MAQTRKTRDYLLDAGDCTANPINITRPEQDDLRALNWNCCEFHSCGRRNTAGVNLYRDLSRRETGLQRLQHHGILAAKDLLHEAQSLEECSDHCCPWPTPWRSLDPASLELASRVPGTILIQTLYRSCIILPLLVQLPISRSSPTVGHIVPERRQQRILLQLSTQLNATPKSTEYKALQPSPVVKNTSTSPEEVSCDPVQPRLMEPDGHWRVSPSPGHAVDMLHAGTWLDGRCLDMIPALQGCMPLKRTQSLCRTVEAAALTARQVVLHDQAERS